MLHTFKANAVSRSSLHHVKHSLATTNQKIHQTAQQQQQKHFSQSVLSQQQKKSKKETDDFSTAFDLDESELKEILKNEGSLGEVEPSSSDASSFDPSKHYDIDAVLPKVAKNVEYKRTHRLIRMLKAKVTHQQVAASSAKGGEKKEDKDSSNEGMYWRMYNRERQRPELSDFQQQLEQFPNSIYGNDSAGRADVDMMTQAVQVLSDKQLGIERKARDQVFDTLAKVEIDGINKQQTTDDSSGFSLSASTQHDEIFVEPWVQKNIEDASQSLRITQVFNMLHKQLNKKRMEEGKKLYDEEVKKHMLSDQEGKHYLAPVVEENVAAEAKRAEALIEPKYGEVVTKSSKNADMTALSASPTSLPGRAIKTITESHTRHIASNFNDLYSMGDTFSTAPKKPEKKSVLEKVTLSEDKYIFNESSTTPEANELIDNPVAYTHQETRFFLNDEQYNRQFEEDLRNDLKTKSLEQIYRERPYLLLDPLALTIRELNDVSAEELAAPFEPAHLKTLFSGVLQGRAPRSIGQFFQSISEVTDREGLLAKLQLLLPNYSRTKIDSILGKIVTGLVQQNKVNDMLETKEYSGTKRSVISLTDLLNGNSQPGNMSMSDFLARPRPKIEAVMYAVDQIAKAQVEEGTLQLVAELGKTNNEKDFASEWDYLYEVLKPIHGASQLNAGAAKGRRIYQPQIYSGLVRASGTRKDSRAHVVMTPGTGVFSINGRNYLDYFKRRSDLLKLGLPFKITQTFQQFDIYVKAEGGGTTGQRDAIKLAISKAFAKFIPEFGYALSANSMMTVDMRHVERKKFGLVKARKRATFVKR